MEEIFQPVLRDTCALVNEQIDCALQSNVGNIEVSKAMNHFIDVSHY